MKRFIEGFTYLFFASFILLLFCAKHEEEVVHRVSEEDYYTTQPAQTEQPVQTPPPVQAPAQTEPVVQNDSTVLTMGVNEGEVVNCDKRNINEIIYLGMPSPDVFAISGWDYEYAVTSYYSIRTREFSIPSIKGSDCGINNPRTYRLISVSPDKLIVKVINNGKN